MNREKTKQLTSCALFAAIIYVATAVTGAVAPIGGGAYIHLGAAMIYISVLFLPAPYAVAAAAVGAALADFTLGSAVYIIPTIIVKSLVVLTAKGLMRLSKNALLQDILICLAGVTTVIGYYIAEVVLMLISGSQFNAALAGAAVNSIPFNTLQAGASAVVFLIVGGVVRKIADRKKKSAPSVDSEEGSDSAQ